MFLVQRRAFKVFNKEVSNDLYSSKKLLQKCFFFDKKANNFYQSMPENFSLYSTHIGFWSEFTNFKSNYYLCFTNHIVSYS